MGVNNNWRPAHTMDDWMRDIEKRLMHEERRPSWPHPSDVVGPGFRPYAIQVDDWNSDGSIVNGYFHSVANQVVGSPDDTKNWMGIVQANQFGQGLQRVWEYIDEAEDPSPDPALFTRAFYTHDDGVREYTPWVQGSGGGGGTDGVDVYNAADLIVDDATILDFQGPGVTTIEDGPGRAMILVNGLRVTDEGTNVFDPTLGSVDWLDFTGDGVTVTPGATWGRAQVHIPGGGSGVTGDLDSYTAICTTELNPVPGTPTNVPGCIVTVAVGGPDEHLLVVGTGDLGWISGSATGVVSLYVDGTEWVDPDTGVITQIVLTSSTAQRNTLHQNWLLHGLTAGDHVLNFKAASLAGSVRCRTHTRFTAVRLVGAIGPQGPPGGAIGPAGGDLTGTYPDPQLGVGVIDPSNIQFNAIYPGHISPNTIDHTFVQAVAASTWVINHPLHFRPAVTVVDSSGRQVEGDVVYTDADTVTIGFSGAFAGTAYLS